MEELDKERPRGEVLDVLWEPPTVVNQTVKEFFLSTACSDHGP